MLVFVYADTCTNATLLNCWKFLIADVYQTVREQSRRWPTPTLSYESLCSGKVRITSDVTMDNQQPRLHVYTPLECARVAAVHRLRW
jgi:hypothetical protein